MKPMPIDFLLTPDGASARGVRKRLAEQSPGLNRLAGTWPELMAQAEADYLLPPVTDVWPEKLKQAAARRQDAFWAASLEVAPRETLAELDAALHRLLEAAGPDSEGQDLLSKIPAESRLHRRLSDLLQVVAAVGSLPGALQKMACLLTGRQPPLRAIRVYYCRERMDLDPWQTAVLDKIEGDAPPRDPHLQSILETALAFPEADSAALKAVCNLYHGETPPPPKIDGVRIIAARDRLAEAEIAAGLIQNAITGGCPMAEIGLLLPDDAFGLARGRARWV